MWHHGLNKESARLSLVVPAFDEARTIETVLDRVFDSIPDVHEVIVIDDASSDRHIGGLSRIYRQGAKGQASSARDQSR